MQVLYLGRDDGTSRHRHLALKRLGHHVHLINVYESLEGSRLLTTWAFNTGALGLAKSVERNVRRQVGTAKYDIVLVDSGELVAPNLLQFLKSIARITINYNPDNPYAGRDGHRWRLFLKALPLYDVVVTPRGKSVAKAYDAGAKRVLQVHFAADEVVHRSIDLTEHDRYRFASHVVFVGTWMPERGPILSRLVQRGVPLMIYGERWRKAPEFPILERYIAGRGLADDEYPRAIQCAKIALGLLSKGNEDFHTTRSIEIPAIGTLLCAERTVDHLEMYEENEEAVFWADANECANKCLSLLNDGARLARLAKAGHQRALRNGYFNERLLDEIIEFALTA